MSRAALLAAALSLGAAAAAEAEVRGFALISACVSDCAAAGVAVDLPFTLVFYVDDAGYGPGAPIEPSSLRAWTANFGPTLMLYTSVAGTSFAGTWGAEPGKVGSISFESAVETSAPGGPGFQFLYNFGPIGISSGVASLAAFCTAADCGGIDFGGAPARFEPVTLLVAPAPAPIPAPASLLLAASGSAGLVLAARRRSPRKRERSGAA